MVTSKRKETLDKYLPPESSEVVISTQGKKDSERLQKYRLSDDQETAARKRFRNPEEQPKILIVTEKLLTGFDAPILYCMYLDKPMRDHVLLQAIARELLTGSAELRRKVSVHELLHLKLPNHGKLFRSLFRAYVGGGANQS